MLSRAPQRAEARRRIERCAGSRLGSAQKMWTRRRIPFRSRSYSEDAGRSSSALDMVRIIWVHIREIHIDFVHPERRRQRFGARKSRESIDVDSSSGRHMGTCLSAFGRRCRALERIQNGELDISIRRRRKQCRSGHTIEGPRQDQARERSRGKTRRDRWRALTCEVTPPVQGRPAVARRRLLFALCFRLSPSVFPTLLCARWTVVVADWVCVVLAHAHTR